MTRSGRLAWVLLAVVVVVETVLVVAAFNPAPHTGGDNAGYVSLAHTLLTTGSYTEDFDPAGLPHVKYPPVFPALLAVLMALGARSWVALKSTAALATIAAAALTYLWAVRRLGAWSALVVALLFGASSAVVYYSHWILSDPIFLMLTLTALWALDREEEAETRIGWLAVGIAATGLAYFTRSAGLPLVAAVVAWLGWRRRWRPFAAAAVTIGVPAFLWWVRGRGVAGSYASEFWMVDPYQPALGTIGPLALVPRALSNLSGYLLGHGPGGIVGARGVWVSVLGIVLVAGAAYGWLLALRRRVGPTELFLPLYAGLILLWPTVWSGDRFALPLYPLVFLYGALALGRLGARVPRLVGSLGTAALVLAIALPAGASWAREVETARACARSATSAGPFGCWGPRVRAFVTAAEWSAEGLPDGSAVLSRKPRIFYVVSGVPSRTFPFEADPGALLALADALGVRYVLMDEWDGLASAYVGGAVTRQPGAFCYVTGFGRPGAGGAQLLGILTLGARASGPAGTGEGVQLATCPASYSTGEEPVTQSSSSSTRIPLLDGLDP